MNDFIDSGPVASVLHMQIGDATHGVPDIVKARFHSVDQRYDDSRNLWAPISGALQELRPDAYRSQVRIKHLLTPRVAGGAGLEANDVQVQDAQLGLDRINAEITRLHAEAERRAATMRNRGLLKQRTHDWLRDVRARGMVITVVASPEPKNLLKKGETYAGGVERLRRQDGELAANEKRAQDAPHPSSAVSARLLRQLEERAQRAAPDVGPAIEIGGEIRWPLRRERLDLITASADVRGYAAGEVVDVLGVMMWLFPSQFAEAIKREVAMVADDANALATDERGRRLERLAAERLAVHRNEVALIEAATADGVAIEHRGADIDIRAVLGCEVEVRSDEGERGQPFGMAAAALRHVAEIFQPTPAGGA
ncbi:hypothetical protein [Bradyrhizobium sp. USDA 3650]